MSPPPTYAPPGHRVVIDELAESPRDAIDNHVRIEEQAPPDVHDLRSTDVVVRVRSAAVGWVDLVMTSGQYQHMPKPPYVPGLEYAGEVLWAGQDVRSVGVGDAVIADPLRTGPRSLGEYQRYGGFATYAVAPADGLIPLPNNVTFDQGCSLFGNFGTAYHALVVRARLRAGETVLVHGATGATGLAAVQVAKLVGATVIATGRSPDKLRVVQERGADHVLCTSDDRGEPIAFRHEVKALTGGDGVDVVYDGVGGPLTVESLRSTRFGARYLIIGWAATPDVARGKGGRGAPRANVIPTNLILMKGLDVLGSPAAIAAHRDPALAAERMRSIVQWVETKKLVPQVPVAYPLTAVHEAMRAKWESRFVGGCVVHPAEGSAAKP